jgi:hypothetical protein
VRYQAWLLTGLVLPLVTGCPDLIPDTDDANVFRGDGFQLELPEEAVESTALQFAAADSSDAFSDPNDDSVFIHTLPTQDNLGFAPDIFEGVRYDGVATSAAGDQLVLGTVHNADARIPEDATLPFAMAQRDGGGLLMVLADADLESVFNTIELENTDGSGIDDAFSLAQLLAPPADGIVVLGNGATYRLLESDRAPALDWETGSRVAAYDGGSFVDEADEVFLVQAGQWRSLTAEVIGDGETRTVDLISDPGTIVTLTLDDGRDWTVLLSDEDKARGWSAGDDVVLVEDVEFAFGNAILVRRSTGEMIRVAEL